MTGVQTCALPISYLTLINCVFWNINATDENEIYNYGINSYESAVLLNHCSIKGGVAGIHNDPYSSVIDIGGNIDLDPLFVNTPDCSCMTSSSGSTTTVIIANASTDFSVNDVIEIKNDGIARTITNIASNTITFTPALSVATVSGTIIHNWGPGATNLEFDLHLQPSSPCIDTGTSTDAPAADILGVARPQGSSVDMGAYEQ